MRRLQGKNRYGISVLESIDENNFLNNETNSFLGTLSARSHLFCARKNKTTGRPRNQCDSRVTFVAWTTVSTRLKSVFLKMY